MPISDREVASGLVRMVDQRLGGEPQTDWAEERKLRVLGLVIEILGGAPVSEAGSVCLRFAQVFEIVAAARYGVTTRDIALKTHLSVSAVQRHLRLLRQAGWVEVDGVVESIKGPRGEFIGSRQMFTHRVNPKALFKFSQQHLEVLNKAQEIKNEVSSR